MTEQMMRAAYEDWQDSNEYWNQSALENKIYDNNKREIVSIIGGEKYDEIYEFVVNLATEAENAAFNEGIRRGILFMADIMKGGAAHA